MEVSCLMSSYCFCNAQLFINPNPNPETGFFKKKTNPNPDHTFYWHPFKFVPFFMHTHPTPLPIPTLFLGILLFDAFENVYIFCFISWCQLQLISAISSVFVLKSTVTLERGHSIFYLPPAPPTPSLPQGEFLNSGAKILFGLFGHFFQNSSHASGASKKLRVQTPAMFQERVGRGGH